MITLTDEAIKQVKILLDSRGKASSGIRIGISTKGCSGLSYTLEFVDKIDTNCLIREDFILSQDTANQSLTEIY